MAEQELSPPVSGNDVTAGAEALAKAICWLSSTVQEERAARLAFESRLATRSTLDSGGTPAEQASASVSPEDVPSAALKSSVLTPEELQGLRDSIAAQVRESVLAELAAPKGAASGSVEQTASQSSNVEPKVVDRELKFDCALPVDPEANQDQLLGQQDPRFQALIERLDKLDERVNGLTSNPSGTLNVVETPMGPSDSMNSERSGDVSRRLASLEASLQDLTLKLEAVNVLPHSSAAEQKLQRSGSKSRYAEELRSELMKFIQVQISNLKDSSEARTGDAKDVADAVANLRLELTSLLHDQLDNLRAQVKLDVDQVANPYWSDASGLNAGSEGMLSPGNFSPTTAQDVSDAVSKAVGDLREEVGTWLEEQLGSYAVGRRFSDTSAQAAQNVVAQSESAQQSTTQPPEVSPVTSKVGEAPVESPGNPQVTAATQTSRTSLSTPGTKAEVGSAEETRPSPTEATQVVGQIREEIFNWLEEQLTKLREEIAERSRAAMQDVPSISIAPPKEASPQEQASVPTDPVQEQRQQSAPTPSPLVIQSEQQLNAPAHAPPQSPKAAPRPRPTSAVSNASNRTEDSTTVVFTPTVVPDSIYGNLDNVVKFFQGQLDDVRKALLTSRADAVKSATNALRNEMKGQLDKELVEFQMRLKAGLEDTDMHAEGDTSVAAYLRRHISDTLDKELDAHFAKLLSEIVTKLLADDDFNLVISQRCQVAVSANAGNSGATKASRGSLVELGNELDDLVENNAQRPEFLALPSKTDGQNSALVGNLLGSGGTTISKLESRLSALERQVAVELEERKPSKQISLVAHTPPDQGSLQGDPSTAENPPDFLSLMEVHDDLRRLKTRFEYLERCAPPEVQKALSFFEPVREETSQAHDADHQGGQASQLVGSAALMRRLQELQTAQDSDLDEAKNNSEEARREVANLSRALRGVQRDGEVHGSKLLDIQKSLSEQQKRLEVALPAFMQSLERLLGSDLQAGGESDVAAGLRALLLPGDGVDGSKAPFVSENGLRQALEALQGEVQAWLSKLREDISSVLRNKADTDLVRSIMEQLEQVQTTSPMIQNPDQGQFTDGAAILRVPLMQGRCVACDAQIGMRAEDPNNWPKQKMKPSPPWPQRGPGVPPALDPLGRLRPIPNWPVVEGSHVANVSDSDARPKAIRPVSGVSVGSGNMKRHESLPSIAPNTLDSGRQLR